MSWFKIVEELERMDMLTKKSVFSIVERLNFPDEVREMSLIGQFFVASCVLVDSRTVVQVPIFTQRERDILLREVAPHLTSCKIMHFQDEERTIAILSGVKSDSKDLFLRLREEGELHPLVTDLFREGGIRQDRMSNVPVLYELSKEAIGVSEPDGFRELWDFISNTFVTEQSDFTIIPSGWEFGEPIKASLYLQALNGVCSKLRLYVDPNSNCVIGISGVV